MSWEALSWAETAPVANVYERVILLQMAARADPDGTGVWLGPGTLARRAVCDEKTIKRGLRRMRERGLIAYGDQSRAKHIPANRRPMVYDLMIPATSYSAKALEDVNADRAERGLPPITPENRPDIPDVEPLRKVRSDASKSRSDEDVQPLTWGDDLGGLQDPPAGDPPEISGGSSRPLQGGLLDPPRGVYETPKSLSSNHSLETPEGGYEPGERHPRERPPARDDPPPPSTAWWMNPNHWLCREHLAVVKADPGADIPACGRCARAKADARPRYDAWQAELAEQASARERAERLAEIERERAARAEAHAAALASLEGAGHQEYLREREALARRCPRPATTTRRRRPARRAAKEPVPAS